MLETIIKVLKNSEYISGYVITETMVEANELFFIKKNVDMDRAKSVHHFKVTVYVDYEENGVKYKGSSTVKIHPTMSEAEIENAVGDAAFAARFVKNQYYPLVKPTAAYNRAEPSKFSMESLPYWMNEITKAIYHKDEFAQGGINSCEIFLNRVYSHVINSEGVDVDTTNYNGMVEFITTWREDGEEIELYKCLDFSDFDPEQLAEEVGEMIRSCREKAIADYTPALGKATVLLTREAVKDFFQYYFIKSNAMSVYHQTSTWKIGDEVQGEEVKGDRITITLDPHMKNSTFSNGFDADGLPLEAVTILDQGVLKNYIADTRHAFYLNVQPTGLIRNMIVNGGSKSIIELKETSHLEIAAFSDFSVDKITGDFGGEIRLAWYYDGEKRTPVTGGSITGNINELHHELYLSRELQKDNYFEGPAVIQLFNVNVGGRD